MQIMARWQTLGPGDPPGASRGAGSQWDGDSVPSSPLTSISVWAEVLLKKSLLRVSFQPLRSSHQPGGAGTACQLLRGASHGLWGANGIRRVQGW